jgi:hypothetical protein
VLLYECVILQMRIGFADAIEFRALTRREILLRIETPAPFEQALTPQYLMNARNTSLKIVRGIEDGGIRICDLLRQRQQFARNRVGMTLGEGEVRNGSLRPHRPMPQQAAGDSEGLSAEGKLREQVVQNVVIVSCVKSHFLGATGLRQGTNNIQRLIAVKRCDLNRDDVFNLDELAPEFVGQQTPSDGGLQVETDNGDDGGNGACVFQKLRDGFVFQLGKAQQRSIVAQPGGEFPFG